MERFTCLAKIFIGKNKKHKKSLSVVDESKKGVSDCKFMVNAINFSIPSNENSIEKFNFTFSESFSPLEKRYSLIPSVPSGDSLTRTESAGETAYEGGDEHDGILSMKGDYSDLDLQEKEEIVSHGSNTDLNDYVYNNMIEMNEGFTPRPIFAGEPVSDPGMGCKSFRVSPVLKRSCSNIESKRADKSMKSKKRSNSYVGLHNLSGNFGGNFLYEAQSSSLTVKSSCSADRVMLKKSSSCHRDLHDPSAPQRLASVLSTANQRVRYSSDTHEPVQKSDMKNKAMGTENKWVSFSLLASPQDRVDAWVNSLKDYTTLEIDDEETCDGKEGEGAAGLLHMKIGETSAKNHSLHSQQAEKEVMEANHIIQSLNLFSTAAHICGMGLKVIPSISAFGNLRSVSLSGNLIVQITPRCLPKNLHTLDISRNKLSTTEGLRYLARLRVLNLSYNRISRIGHGLSNCTVIKELYLAGNKISDVEGLHRLLKLTVLDLSFNKIITAKALGQLVGNYHSLLALNLIGNPIQSNIGDDQIKKAVLSLLPHITYLNKQPIKQDRVREAAANSIAKAALGDEGSNHRRRPTRRSRHTKDKQKSNMGFGS